MAEENVYANLPVLRKNKGSSSGKPRRRRSKVRAERLALLVVSVLMLAAVRALIGVIVHFRNLFEDNDIATGESTTASGTTLFLTSPNLVPHCEDGWELHGTKCYYFSRSQLKWNESRAECESFGGDLVKIDSREEQVFLDSTVQLLMGTWSDRFWIGLTDSGTEGQWLWTDGSQLNQSLAFWINNKNNKEPDNWTKEDPEGEDCAVMGETRYMNGTNSWYDQICKKTQRYVCEKTAPDQ